VAAVAHVGAKHHARQAFPDGRPRTLADLRPDRDRRHLARMFGAK
jgi:hypothetical protein